MSKSHGVFHENLAAHRQGHRVMPNHFPLLTGHFPFSPFLLFQQDSLAICLWANPSGPRPCKPSKPEVGRRIRGAALKTQQGRSG